MTRREYITPQELSEQLGIALRTIRRWRTEGKLVERNDRTEIIYLASIKTPRVLIPISHEEDLGSGQRLLGKTEFIAALAWSDPVLRRAEVELFL